VTGQFRHPSGIYPYGFSDPETALTVLMLIANGVSALMGVGIVVLVYVTARDLFGRTGALFAALIVAFSPPFVYYAHTSNVDTPSLFWGDASTTPCWGARSAWRSPPKSRPTECSCWFRSRCWCCMPATINPPRD
jgi:Dolichyl-phosphate-mannose-protein mannosyltransferase